MTDTTDEDNSTMPKEVTHDPEIVLKESTLKRLIKTALLEHKEEENLLMKKRQRLSRNVFGPFNESPYYSDLSNSSSSPATRSISSKEMVGDSGGEESVFSTSSKSARQRYNESLLENKNSIKFYSVSQYDKHLQELNNENRIISTIADAGAMFVDELKELIDKMPSTKRDADRISEIIKECLSPLPKLGLKSTKSGIRYQWLQLTEKLFTGLVNPFLPTTTKDIHRYKTDLATNLRIYLFANHVNITYKMPIMRDGKPIGVRTEILEPLPTINVIKQQLSKKLGERTANEFKQLQSLSDEADKEDVEKEMRGEELDPRLSPIKKQKNKKKDASTAHQILSRARKIQPSSALSSERAVLQAVVLSSAASSVNKIPTPHQRVLPSNKLPPKPPKGTSKASKANNASCIAYGGDDGGSDGDTEEEDIGRGDKRRALGNQEQEDQEREEQEKTDWLFDD